MFHTPRKCMSTLLINIGLLVAYIGRLVACVDRLVASVDRLVASVDRLVACVDRLVACVDWLVSMIVDRPVDYGTLWIWHIIITRCRRTRVDVARLPVAVVIVCRIVAILSGRALR